MSLLGMFKPKIKVVTHSGSFHPDDVFACATIELWARKNNRKVEIKRTRDESEFAPADMVVDVGTEYDSVRNRFDHHQKGGAGARENMIPYASFGLVWKKFGEEICGSKEIADVVEGKLVAPIDAHDNGIKISTPLFQGVIEYRTGESISAFNPTSLEDYSSTDQAFFTALAFAQEILKREIAQARAEDEGARLTSKAIEKQNNPEVLILEKAINWEKEVSKNKNIKFVVYPHKNGKDWSVQTGRDNLEDYNSDRANFPKSWQGLRDGELAKVIGMTDAIFCSNGGWFAVARSKETAIKMAKMALNQS